MKKYQNYSKCECLVSQLVLGCSSSTQVHAFSTTIHFTTTLVILRKALFQNTHDRIARLLFGNIRFIYSGYVMSVGSGCICFVYFYTFVITVYICNVNHCLFKYLVCILNMQIGAYYTKVLTSLSKLELSQLGQVTSSCC